MLLLWLRSNLFYSNARAPVVKQVILSRSLHHQIGCADYVQLMGGFELLCDLTDSALAAGETAIATHSQHGASNQGLGCTLPSQLFLAVPSTTLQKCVLLLQVQTSCLVHLFLSCALLISLLHAAFIFFSFTVRLPHPKAISYVLRLPDTYVRMLE